MEYSERAERFKKARTILNKNGSKTLEQVYQDTGIMKSLVSDLESEFKDRGVKYQDIATLAKYYGVSADYLLGLSENHSIDSNVQAAAMTTGLDGKSIELIQNLPPEEINALQMLLLRPGFFMQIARYLSIPQYGDFGDDDNLELEFFDETDIPYDDKRCIVNNTWLKGPKGERYYIGLDDPDTVIEFTKQTMQHVIIGYLDEITEIWRQISNYGKSENADK